MGILHPIKSKSMEMDEFNKMLLSNVLVLVKSTTTPSETNLRPPETISPTTRDDISDERDQLVCVTSRVSFLGLSIVKELLLRGYSVRLTDANEGKLL
ncbi:hypothetical protein LguiB_004479 [Lonicera macranthoides]